MQIAPLKPTIGVAEGRIWDTGLSSGASSLAGRILNGIIRYNYFLSGEKLIDLPADGQEKRKERKKKFVASVRRRKAHDSLAS